MEKDPFGASESVVVGASDLLANEEVYLSGEPFVFGPIRMGPNLRINVSSPILDTETGRGLVWLGIDLRADEWLKNISLARLQTIIIAGLVLALIIFFIYYQIENESETDLALAKERAEAADRAKSEFLAVMSHEIRTPLQSVLGYSNLLKNTRLDEKQMSCLDTIQSKGKILLRIVQDILDFSNLRKASPELKEGPVRLKKPDRGDLSDDSAHGREEGASSGAGSRPVAAGNHSGGWSAFEAGPVEPLWKFGKVYGERLG